MKLTKRALIWLLTAVMMLAFMPAAAFADYYDSEEDSEPAIPAEVEFTSYTDPKGYIGTTHTDCYLDGSSIHITYSDSTTATYRYLPTDYRYNYEGGFYLYGYRGNGLADFEVGIRTDGYLKEGNNECTFYLKTTDSRGEHEVTCPVNVVGEKDEDIVSVSYKHKDGKVKGEVDYSDRIISYLDGEDRFAELEGDKIVVKKNVVTSYDYYGREEKNLATVEYTCRKEDESGQHEFMTDSGEILMPDFADEQKPGEWTWKSGETGKVKIFALGVAASENLEVSVPEYLAVKDIDLKLAKGFEPKISIGQNDFVDQDAFFGEGNKLIINYSDGTSKECEYREDGGWMGFAYPDDEGSTAYETADFRADLSRSGTVLEKDVPTELTFIYYEDVMDGDKTVSMPVDFKYTVTAKKRAVFEEEGGVYEYTGKVIKPKVVLRTVYGNKKIPSKAFKYTKPDNKEMGEYTVPVEIKDTDNYYAAYYVDDSRLSVSYRIVPKQPEIGEVTGTKNGLVVNWKEFSKADQQNIDGFVIEYAQRRTFSDAETVKAGRNDSSKKIRWMDPGKKYYVRVCSYKKTGGLFGGSKEILSEPTEIASAVTE